MHISCLDMFPDLAKFLVCDHTNIQVTCGLVDPLQGFASWLSTLKFKLWYWKSTIIKLHYSINSRVRTQNSEVDNQLQSTVPSRRHQLKMSQLALVVLANIFITVHH